jgi:[ribosomal protein S5]-alanine N-acetyltransferase
MKILIETERLFIRELNESDKQDLFEMDSDPSVHFYLENNPVKSMDEIETVIEMISTQYRKNGIGRWAIVHKAGAECIGWCGLKYHTERLNNHINFYELGYRFKKKHWDKGYATESSSAILEYAFKHIEMHSVFAITDPKNMKSKNVLSKLGFKFVETFNLDGEPTDWFELRNNA